LTLLGVQNPVWLAIKAAAPTVTFASLYESFQALTSIQVSHFVEWFSGINWDSIWTLTNNTGSGTASANDAIDGGFNVISGAVNNANTIMNFNDKRHYDPTGAILIAIIERVSGNATAKSSTGFCEEFSFANDFAFVINDNARTFYELETSDASTSSAAASDIAVDITTSHVHKIECGSADIKLTIDGVLKVTKTTNRPTTPQQPFIHAGVGNEGGASGFTNVRYLEAFNTSISILSSLYERLSALTQIMGQRVVETFSGALLNERWLTESIGGTGSFAMDDGIDLGFKITSPAVDGALGTIHFSEKRQYAFDESIIISVSRLNETTNFAMQVGLISDVSVSQTLQTAALNCGSPGTFRLRTGNATSSSLQDTSLSVDTVFHTSKVECSSADIKLTMDGVLEVTKTTFRPTVKLQPYAFTLASGASSARSMNLRYIEAYNKLTTETIFPSVYELFNELTTLARQHFWEWFDGNALSNRWTLTNVSGGGTPVMADGIDEGFSLTAQIGPPNRSSINFDNKRPFDEIACVMISVARRVSTAAGEITIGLFNSNTSPSPDSAYLIEGTVNTFKRLGTFGAASATLTDSTVAIDTAFHVHKIECGSADIKLTIDGVLEVTTTTDRPTQRLQPLMFATSDGSPGTEVRTRYIEAFNVIPPPVPPVEPFDSLYESFQALTAIQVSHFVEWFSGSVLDSIWTQENINGTGSFVMADEIDGGLLVTSAAVDGAISSIHFNNKRHYAFDASIIIGVSRTNSTSFFNSQVGLVNDVAQPTDLDQVAIQLDFANGFFNLKTGDAASSSLTATSITKDTAFHGWKIECGSADIKLTLDGVLEVTKTTNRPTKKMQPYANIGAAGDSQPTSHNIRYIEAFNTSVTILSSLYERLSALTQIMNQRVVETFSGALLNERWTSSNYAGVNTFEMVDSIDGGFKITTDSSTNDSGAIHFNDKHQYDFENSVMIANLKLGSANAQISVVGFVKDQTGGIHTDIAYCGFFSSASTTLFLVRTFDGTGSSFTNSDVLADTIFHVHKLDLSSANVKYFIDGVLKVTKTTDLPISKLQPFFTVATEQEAVKNASLNYFEAYNKLTTETDFPSVYEMFNPLTTIGKQHFWEWFDGSDLSNRWVKNQVLGTGTTFLILDTIDGGLELISDSVSQGSLSFGDIRPFDPAAAIMLAVVEFTAAPYDSSVGFSNDELGVGGPQQACFHIPSTSSFIQAQSGDGSTSETATTVAPSITSHSYKLELTSADLLYTIDGVLEVTKTTNRPTDPQQPNVSMSSSNGFGNMAIRYYEALNT